MIRTKCIVLFLRSSSVCVLLPIDIFFGCAGIKLDINGIASYRIAYKNISIYRPALIYIYIYILKNAGFSLLGHFIGLFFISLPRCWVILNLGYFFLPNRWFDPVSGETSQQRSWCEQGLFKSTGESGSQRCCWRFSALFRGNKGLYTFYFIYKVCET